MKDDLLAICERLRGYKEDSFAVLEARKTENNVWELKVIRQEPDKVEVENADNK